MRLVCPELIIGTVSSFVNLLTVKGLGGVGKSYYVYDGVAPETHHQISTVVSDVDDLGTREILRQLGANWGYRNLLFVRSYELRQILLQLSLRHVVALELLGIVSWTWVIIYRVWCNQECNLQRHEGRCGLIKQSGLVIQISSISYHIDPAGW